MAKQYLDNMLILLMTTVLKILMKSLNNALAMPEFPITVFRSKIPESLWQEPINSLQGCDFFQIKNTNPGKPGHVISLQSINGLLPYVFCDFISG